MLESLLGAKYCVLKTQEAQSLALQEFKLRLEGSTEDLRDKAAGRGNSRQRPTEQMPGPQECNIPGAALHHAALSSRPWGRGLGYTLWLPIPELNFERGTTINLIRKKKNS